MANFNRYAGEPTGNQGLSPALWGDLNLLQPLVETGAAYRLSDDFLQFLEATNGWAVGGTNNTAVVPADEVGGAVTIGATGADNDEGWLTSGNNEGGFCKIYTTAPRALYFEARVKVSSIADQGVFVGLSEEGLAAAGTLADDSGALASKDFVGFHVDTAAPSTVDFVYRKANQAAVVVKAGAATLVAGTYVKLGFVFDGTYLKCFVDGVEVAPDSTVTGANVNYGLKVADATNFPDGEELAVLVGVKTGEGVAKTIVTDWVDVVQKR